MKGISDNLPPGDPGDKLHFNDFYIRFLGLTPVRGIRRIHICWPGAVTLLDIKTRRRLVSVRSHSFTSLSGRSNTSLGECLGSHIMKVFIEDLISNIQ